MSSSTDSTAPILNSTEAARAAGLRYVSDCDPGLRRERLEDGGFRYVGLDGEPVADAKVLTRIEKLRIPPAWDEVWICARPNGHIQATGRDARGRKQYRYHAGWNAARSQTKYDRLLIFGEALPALRERVDADLSRRGLPRQKVLATVLSLMDTTLIRVGNKEYARANKSYGLTTMRDKHVTVEGATIRFHFIGKSGQKHAIDVRDRRLARIVKQCRDIPGYQLFQYYDEDGARQDVSSGDVNNYLREVTGAEFSAKDFRTWGGSVLAAVTLCALEPAESEAATRGNVVQAVKEVAAALGNRPATCRKYYIHPAVLEGYGAGTLPDEWADAISAAETQPSPGLTAEEAALMTILRRAGS